MTGLICFLCGVGVMWCLTKLNSKYKLDFIDEEDVEFVDELENPKKYHYEEHSDDTIHFYKDYAETIVDLLNEQDETIKKQNQEILSCHDTLVTIEALCDAVLNYEFKNVTDKVDFCHMLNEMDNKDLMFLKECFEAIKNNDLKQMASLTVECMGDVE